MRSVHFLYSKYYDKHDNLMLAFACRVNKAQPKLSGEVSEASWFTPDAAYDALFEGAYGRDMLQMWKTMSK